MLVTTPETECTMSVPTIWMPENLEQPLEAMPQMQQFAGWIINPYKNHVLPASWLTRLLQSSKSKLLAETFRRPGGWRTMEMMYQNPDPTDWLDRQALRDNPIARASRNRLQIVTQILMDLITSYHSNTKITLVGVGAGPGRHVQTAISRLNLDAKQIQAFLIDLDDDAFDYGCRLADQLGISDCINFLQGDARQIQSVLPEVKPHIVKLIGLVEYLNDQQLFELLTALHAVMVPGGALVTHGMLDPWNGKPFLKRIFGLQHNLRTGSEIQQILEKAGFRITNQITEPMGIYPILTAVK